MQTLLSLLALALAGLLSLNMNRRATHTEGAMVEAQVAALALAAAASELDAAGELPFDASADPAALTLPTGFGTEAGTVAAARDLDDLHGARRTVDVETPDGSLPLEVLASVRYVELASGGEYRTSTVPTLLKELSVSVVGPGGGQATLRRLYAFQPAG